MSLLELFNKKGKLLILTLVIPSLFLLPPTMVLGPNFLAQIISKVEVLLTIKVVEDMELIMANIADFMATPFILLIHVIINMVSYPVKEAKILPPMLMQLLLNQ